MQVSERSIYTLMVHILCILSSFHVYFIIFPPLSPRLKYKIVLADFTLSSFIYMQARICPSLCGKGTERGQLRSLLAALSMTWSQFVLLVVPFCYLLHKDNTIYPYQAVLQGCLQWKTWRALANSIFFILLITSSTSLPKTTTKKAKTKPKS